MRLWDIETGRDVKSFGDHRGWVFSVDVAPDGREAVSGCVDGMVRLWDLTADRPPRLCAAPGLAMKTSHGLPVRNVVFSPDGRHVLSGGYSMNVRLWNRETAGEAGSGNTRVRRWQETGRQELCDPETSPPTPLRRCAALARLSRVDYLPWHVRLVTEHEEKSVHGRAASVGRLLAEA